MNTAIDFKQVSKSYKEIHALIEIDFTIEEGCFFGLLGPNGAGKSSLINSTAGLIKPDYGTIKVHGYDVIKDYRQTRGLLGVVPQEIIVDPFFTIRELLTLQAGYHGLRGSKQQQWIDELLQRLSLDTKADSMTNELSGGMKRRLLIAMALVHKPRVLILDEPTAGVDVDLRHTLWEFTQELHKQGHTIILTTHYLEEAEALCERVAIMQKGKLIALDTTKSLLQMHNYQYLDIQYEKLPEKWSSEISKHLVDVQPNNALLKLEKDFSLNKVLSLLEKENINLSGLSTRTASLEEVFLDLVAKKNIS